MSSTIFSLPPLPPISSDQAQVHYNFNGKVMLAAMLIFLIVILFVLSLHVYAKWFWRPRNRAILALSNAHLRGGWRHRQGLITISGAADEAVLTAQMGLDAATINSLPTFIYQASNHPDGKAPLLECAVCLSEFLPYEKGRQLPNCRHSFHIGCIDTWFGANSTCPLCRAPVSPWMPQQHAQPLSAASQGFLLELPSTANGSNEHTALQSSLPDGSTSTITGPHAQCIVVIPPCALNPGNSGIQLQEPQGAIPNEIKLPWKLHQKGQFQVRCNADSTSEPSSASPTSAEMGEQGRESGASIARCQSLGVPRCQSEDMEGCTSQQMKSRSFRMSIKRLLSRELSRGRWGRVFPSAASDAPHQGEHDKEENSSASTSPPP